MMLKILDAWNAFWKFVGELLFYPTEVGGYMDGPQTLFRITVFCIIGAFIIHRILTRDERKKRKDLIISCSNQIALSNMDVKQADEFIIDMYEATFEEGFMDKKEKLDFVKEVYARMHEPFDYQSFELKMELEDEEHLNK